MEKERKEFICGAQLLCWTYEVMIKDHIRSRPVQDAFHVGLYVIAEIYRFYTNYTERQYKYVTFLT